MISFLIGFFVAWCISGIFLYIFNSVNPYPDWVILILSLPIQIITLPFQIYSIKKQRKIHEELDKGLRK